MSPRFKTHHFLHLRDGEPCRIGQRVSHLTSWRHRGGGRHRRESVVSTTDRWPLHSTRFSSPNSFRQSTAAGSSSPPCVYHGDGSGAHGREALESFLTTESRETTPLCRSRPSYAPSSLSGLDVHAAVERPVVRLPGGPPRQSDRFTGRHSPRARSLRQGRRRFRRAAAAARGPLRIAASSWNRPLRFNRAAELRIASAPSIVDAAHSLTSCSVSGTY